MDKKELMKQLLDLYEQREFVNLPYSRSIVDSYISKLESMLVKELKRG